MFQIFKYSIFLAHFISQTLSQVRIGLNYVEQLEINTNDHTISMTGSNNYCFVSMKNGCKIRKCKYKKLKAPKLSRQWNFLYLKNKVRIESIKYPGKCMVLHKREIEFNYRVKLEDCEASFENNYQWFSYTDSKLHTVVEDSRVVCFKFKYRQPIDAAICKDVICNQNRAKADRCDSCSMKDSTKCLTCRTDSYKVDKNGDCKPINQLNNCEDRYASIGILLGPNKQDEFACKSCVPGNRKKCLTCFTDGAVVNSLKTGCKCPTGSGLSYIYDNDMNIIGAKCVRSCLDPENETDVKKRNFCSSCRSDNVSICETCADKNMLRTFSTVNGVLQSKCECKPLYVIHEKRNRPEPFCKLQSKIVTKKKKREDRKKQRKDNRDNTTGPNTNGKSLKNSGPNSVTDIYDNELYGEAEYFNYIEDSHLQLAMQPGISRIFEKPG